MGKKYPMSLSMSLDTKKALEVAAKEKGISTSELVRQLIDDTIPVDIKEVLDVAARKKGISMFDFLRCVVQNFGLGRDNIKTVVLQIPVNLLENRELLEQWLTDKNAAIVGKLFNGDHNATFSKTS